MVTIQDTWEGGHAGRRVIDLWKGFAKWGICLVCGRGLWKGEIVTARYTQLATLPALNFQAEQKLTLVWHCSHNIPSLCIGRGREGLGGRG